jgi:hypothetical protein
VTILDRYVLSRCALALIAGFACEAAALALLGPDAGTMAGAFVLGSGLAIVYTRLARDREYLALLAAGVAPRRVNAAVVAVTALVQIAVVASCCALAGARAPSAYLGYALAGLQPVFIASSALPICVRSRDREPWAQMFLLLLAYVACVVAAGVAAAFQHVGPGLSWLYVVPALAVIDVLLFRGRVAG